jgi:peptidoglycan/xylan/chitin deacetylase (PgdA/CDA1 family)
MMALGKTLYRTMSRTGLPRRRRGRQSTAAIFGFHNVVHDSVAGKVGEGPLHLGISAFEQYVDWIAHTYNVIPLQELLGRLSGGKSVLGTACLTFDDGYRGVFINALPVLHRHQAPATVFIVTGHAESPGYFWWDREELQAASWNLIRVAAHADISIGAHSVTHRNLVALSAAEAHEELEASLNAVRTRADITAQLIAYPYGRVNSEIVALARRSGFTGGIGERYGLTNSCSDPLRLPRVNVPSGIPLETLECWAAGLRVSLP